MNPGLETAYRALGSSAQELYRALGGHPSPRFISEAATAMLASDTVTAEQAVSELRTAGLVQDSPGGFAMPPLIQEHAHNLARRIDTPATPQIIRMRVIHQAYLPLAAQADFCLGGQRHRYNADHYADLVSGCRKPCFLDNRAAMTWYAMEIGTLASIQGQALVDGDHGAVWRLAEALWGYVVKTRNVEVLRRTHLPGCDSARQTGSPVASVLWTRVSWGHRHQGRLRDAVGAATTAYRLATQSGDAEAESLALNAQGQALRCEKAFPEALTFLRRSLRIADRLGNTEQAAMCLRHIAACYLARGQPEEATGHLRAAAARMRLADSPDGLGRVLIMLAQIQIKTDPDHTLDLAHAALEAMQSSGSDCYLGDAFACAGAATAALGQREQARQYYQRAQDYYAMARNADGVRRMATALVST